MDEQEQKKVKKQIIKLFDSKKGNVTESLNELIEQRQLIGTIAGEYAAKIALKEGTDESLKNSGEKMGAFITKVDMLTTKYAIEAFVQEIEKTLNPFSENHGFNPIKKMKEEKCEMWAKSVSHAMEDIEHDYFKREVLIGSVTRFYLMDTKPFKTGNDELFKEILEKHGIVPVTIKHEFDKIEYQYDSMLDTQGIIFKENPTHKMKERKEIAIENVNRLNEKFKDMESILALLEKDFSHLPVFAQRKDVQEFKKIVEQSPFFSNENTKKPKIK
jgi:hypothetical protein